MSPKLKQALNAAEEVQLTVTGRKSGRKIPRPVWYVVDGDKILLLPVYGGGTEWYKNLSKNPTTTISAGKESFTGKAVLIKDKRRVEEIADKFRAKFGAGDVKRYYSKFDVAIELTMP